MFLLITRSSSMPVPAIPVNATISYSIYILICTTTECKQWICIENQLSGFYFKITLTRNGLSMTNHEVHWLSNSFLHIKI